MWFESQNCAMMGVQVTSGKRKLETAATAGGDLSPAKTGRWEPPVVGGGGEVLAGTGATEDCIARLQAVAVPGDAWRPSPTATPCPQSNITSNTGATAISATNGTPSSTAEMTTTTSLQQNQTSSTDNTTTPIISTSLNGTNGITLLPEDFDDEDDFDDELSDDLSDERCSVPVRYQQLSSYDYHHLHHHSNHHPPPLSPGPQHHHPPSHHHHHPPSHQQQQNPLRPPTVYGSNSWHYYAPPQQQKILCEENGKSYLELGAAPVQPPIRTRCCDGRTRWCNVPCYRQRRLAVLNLSMCKLARYRQCSDPSLRRSVLICNTLRHIEREMEAEGNQGAGPPPPPPPPEPQCYSPSAAFTECTPLTPVSPQQQRLTPGVQPLDAYEHNLRDFASSSGRATPFPAAPTDADSGIGDEDSGRGAINWGTVLSLTSQTDLEPLNNNEFYAELGLGAPTSDLSTTTTFGGQEWKEHGEWDSFMHVLVGGS